MTASASRRYSYERKNIEAHLRSSNISPITKAPLEHKLLVPNHQLRGQIQSWFESLAEVEAAGSAKHDDDDLIPAVAAQPSPDSPAGTGPVIEAVGMMAWGAVGETSGNSTPTSQRGVKGLVKKLSQNFGLNGAAGGK